MHETQHNHSIHITVCKHLRFLGRGEEKEGKSYHSHHMSQFYVYATYFDISLCYILPELLIKRHKPIQTDACIDNMDTVEGLL